MRNYASIADVKVVRLEQFLQWVNFLLNFIYTLNIGLDTNSFLLPMGLVCIPSTLCPSAFQFCMDAFLFKRYKRHWWQKWNFKRRHWYAERTQTQKVRVTVRNDYFRVNFIYLSLIFIRNNHYYNSRQILDFNLIHLKRCHIKIELSQNFCIHMSFRHYWLALQ